MSSFLSTASKRAVLLFAMLMGMATLSTPAQALTINGCNIAAHTSCPGANLSHSNLNGADLRGANLSGANLGHIQGQGANFNGANLAGANFAGSNLSKAHFVSTNLNDVHMNAVVVQDTNFTSASLVRINLHGSQVNNGNFSHATLTHAKLTATNFVGANFYKAHLSHSDAGGANFYAVNLHDAWLQSTRVEHASFVGAKFQNTSMENAKAHGANFKGSTIESDSKAVNAIFQRIRVHANGYPRTSYNLPGGGCTNLNPGRDKYPADFTVGKGTCLSSIEETQTSFLEVNPHYLDKKFLHFTWENLPDGGRDFKVYTTGMSHYFEMSGSAPGNGGAFYVKHVHGHGSWFPTGDGDAGKPGGPIAVYLGSTWYQNHGMRGYVLGLTGWLLKKY